MKKGLEKCKYSSWCQLSMRRNRTRTWQRNTCSGFCQILRKTFVSCEGITVLQSGIWGRIYLSHFCSSVFFNNPTECCAAYACWNHISFISPDSQHHWEQLRGMGTRGGPPAGHVCGWRRLQNPEPDEETAESRHPALLHQGGGQHHLWSGPLCGPHWLRLHLDCALPGGWRCRPRPRCLPHRYNHTPVTRNKKSEQCERIDIHKDLLL